MAPTLQVVIGSTRPGRVGPAVADWFLTHATADERFVVERVDLAEVGLPLLDEPHHPRLGRYEHDHTKAWSATVARADAFVFVIPEYNYGLNAATKNALDYLYTEWNHKAAGLVSYGGISAGTRATSMIAPVLTSLQVHVVQPFITIPFVGQALVDGALPDDEHRARAATTMLDALARTTDALAPLR